MSLPLGFLLRGSVVTLALSLIALNPAIAADKSDLDALRGRIDTLKKELAGAEENRSDASDVLRESERGISEANRAMPPRPHHKALSTKA